MVSITARKYPGDTSTTTRQHIIMNQELKCVDFPSKLVADYKDGQNKYNVFGNTEKTSTYFSACEMVLMSTLV